MLGTGFSLEVAKINPRQKKPIHPNCKNWIPWNAIRKNKLPRKFCTTWYMYIFYFTLKQRVFQYLLTGQSLHLLPVAF